MTEYREPITYENRGQKIFGVFHIPSNTKGPAPAVLICHGFGGTKVGNNRLYVRQAEELSKKGIATLRFDFRGCGDSEGDLGDLTVEGEVEDALVSLECLKRHPKVDANRIGLLGISLGGSVSVIAAQNDMNIKSLTLWAPVASGPLWQAEWQQKNPGLSPNLSKEIEYKGWVVGPEFVQQFVRMDLHQPIGNLHHLPLLHIQGEQDETVSTNHREHFENWRNASTASNRFVKLPESDHRFSVIEEQKILIKETTDWFCKTLTI